MTRPWECDHMEAIRLCTDDFRESETGVKDAWILWCRHCGALYGMSEKHRRTDWWLPIRARVAFMKDLHEATSREFFDL